MFSSVSVETAAAATAVNRTIANMRCRSGRRAFISRPGAHHWRVRRPPRSREIPRWPWTLPRRNAYVTDGSRYNDVSLLLSVPQTSDGNISSFQRSLCYNSGNDCQKKKNVFTKTLPWSFDQTRRDCGSRDAGRCTLRSPLFVSVVHRWRDADGEDTHY